MMQQSTNHILMTAPQAFCNNPQTLATNAFQQTVESLPPEGVQAMAYAEFCALRERLIAHGVVVTTLKGQEHTPDDVFCNNWVSIHKNAVFTYPLLAQNRQEERREDVLKLFGNKPRHDLSFLEKEGEALESTGSLVLDRIHKIAYAALSPRTTKKALEKWAALSGYEIVAFNAFGPDGTAIYHTNVMMFIGTGYAGICLDAIAEEDRLRVCQKLEEKHALTVLSTEQMNHFCGNALEVVGTEEKRYLVMSTAAYNAFTKEQKEKLLEYIEGIIHADLSVIEHHGGGSARCMLLEVF